jgi:hypothetical protein
MSILKLIKIRPATFKLKNGDEQKDMICPTYFHFMHLQKTYNSTETKDEQMW